MATRGLRDAVLGRTAYIGDIDAMVQRVTKGQFKRAEQLIQHSAQPEGLGFPATIDAWRLVVCDVPLLEDAQAIQSAYEARLLLEAAQTAAERARELLRTEGERMARQNARWIIPSLQDHEDNGTEPPSPDEDDAAAAAAAASRRALWRQHSVPPPTWMWDDSSADYTAGMLKAVWRERRG